MRVKVPLVTPQSEDQTHTSEPTVARSDPVLLEETHLEGPPKKRKRAAPLRPSDKLPPVPDVVIPVATSSRTSERASTESVSIADDEPARLPESAAISAPSDAQEPSKQEKPKRKRKKVSEPVEPNAGTRYQILAAKQT